MKFIDRVLSAAKILPEILKQLLMVGVLGTAVYFLGTTLKALQKNIVKLVSTLAMAT